MSEAPDPLEAELSALRPHEVSPGLRRGIAQRLAEAPRARRRWLGWLALAGGLAAACLAAVLFWWGNGRRVASRPIVVRPRPALVEDAEPTLLAYERALDRSLEELDALLDKHAGGTPQPAPELMRVGPLTRSDAELHALLGGD